MKLSHYQRFQKLPKDSLSTEIKLSSLYGQGFLRYWPIFKVAIFGDETWPLAKVPKVAHTLSFYPKGSKLSLFLLYGQRFSSYWMTFKISIFGHETWPLTKLLEVTYILSFYLKGPKLSLFSLHRQRFLIYRPFFKNTYLGMEGKASLGTQIN